MFLSIVSYKMLVCILVLNYINILFNFFGVKLICVLFWYVYYKMVISFVGLKSLYFFIYLFRLYFIG